MRRRRPFETIAHRCASLRLRNSCTRPCGLAAAAPRCPRRTAIERQAAADEMHRHRSEEPPDGIGATANLGAGGRGQEAEPQLAQQRQAPLVVGEAGAGLAVGQIGGGGAELTVVPAQAIPGVSDYFVQALAGGESRSLRGRVPARAEWRSRRRRRRSGGRSPPSERTVWNSWRRRGIWVSNSVPPDQGELEPPIHKRLINCSFLRRCGS